MIGYTVLNPLSSTQFNYSWNQITEPASLCVVSDNILEDNQVILASSSQNIVTLTPVALSSPGGTPYHFTNSLKEIFYVQDISTIEKEHEIHISVAGYMIENGAPFQHQAWHGYVTGLSSTSIMRNNNYYGTASDRYEHYKVKYHNGNVYTGGFFQGRSNSGSVLFATPQIYSDECDHTYESLNTDDIYISTPGIVPSYSPMEHLLLHNLPSSVYETYYTECRPFKEEDTAPKLVMPAEDENAITTFYDRITIKDTPSNTKYQIYSVLGQLLQTGATNPDISTLSLSNGIYILQLENGKAFKFVK